MASLDELAEGTAKVLVGYEKYVEDIGLDWARELDNCEMGKLIGQEVGRRVHAKLSWKGGCSEVP